MSWCTGAEDEGQQVRTGGVEGGGLLPPLGVCAGLTQAGSPGFWSRGDAAPEALGPVLASVVL